MTLDRAIRAFCAGAADEHHRYWSWEHCYGYFQRVRGAELVADRDHAALQLGFYLASWGMYRGSSFLLQHAYTVHRPVVDILAKPRFAPLWNPDLGAHEADRRLVPLIREVTGEVRSAYLPFTKETASGGPTDTLVTKVILGTFGCLPACDRYFVQGFQSLGFPYSYLNERFIRRVLEFARENSVALKRERVALHAAKGVSYPIMKLIDMYFWQLGYELDPNAKLITSARTNRDEPDP